MKSNGNGMPKTSIKNAGLMARRNAALLPWKNSRVLNEPPIAPCDFCTMRGCLMPIAVCRVDVGRNRALRQSEALRPSNPSRVMMNAQPAKKPACDGVENVTKYVAKNAANVKPEAPQSRMKLMTVNGVCHSRRKRRQA